MLAMGMGPAVFPRLLLGVMVVLALGLALVDARPRRRGARADSGVSSFSTAPAIFVFMAIALADRPAAGRLPRHRRLRAAVGRAPLAPARGKRGLPDARSSTWCSSRVSGSRSPAASSAMASSESRTWMLSRPAWPSCSTPTCWGSILAGTVSGRDRRRPARPQRQHDGGAAAAADHRHGPDRRASPSSAPSIAPPISAARSPPSSSIRRAIPPRPRPPMTATRWRRAARPGAPSACRRSRAPSAASSASSS